MRNIRGPDWDRLIRVLVGIVLVSGFVAVVFTVAGYPSVGERISIVTYLVTFPALILIWLGIVGLSR